MKDRNDNWNRSEWMTLHLTEWGTEMVVKKKSSQNWRQMSDVIMMTWVHVMHKTKVSPKNLPIFSASADAIPEVHHCRHLLDKNRIKLHK